MCEKCRKDCESCQRLIKTYGENALDICEHCGHYYVNVNNTGFCTCTTSEEELEKSEYLMCTECQLTFPFGELEFGSHGGVYCPKCLEEVKGKKNEMKKFDVIVNVNLGYDFEAKSEEEARMKATAKDLNLPYNYIEESLEIIGIHELDRKTGEWIDV